MKRFVGRVAFVTGGSRGIGKAIAEGFAIEGAKVAIIDINDAALSEAITDMEEKGYEVLALKADVTNREEVETAVQNTVNAFGKVDILVNNAGVVRDNLFFRMTDQDWDTVMNVHLKGAFICSQAVQKVMVENKYGRIINISSTSSLGLRAQANYSTAKAGLQGLTKTLAIELGKFGITVNCLAPGLIETDMTKATAERLGITWEEYLNQRVSNIPVGRSGKPEDVANAVLFFAMEQSTFVSGQILYLAGGPKV